METAVPIRAMHETVWGSEPVRVKLLEASVSS